MLTSNRITTSSDRRRTFTDLRQYVGCRVRARVLPHNLAPPGTTGTVSYVVATESNHIFLAISWDCLTEWTEWYPPDTFLRGVSIEGMPVRQPVPTRRRYREFTTVAAFARLGRRVETTRPVSRAFGEMEGGTVRNVIADHQRIMLAVAWDSTYAQPDAMWFSRAEYYFYLSEARHSTSPTEVGGHE